MTTSYDAIVIGGGSAGLAFAKEAARRDASVLMIERAELGGTCVNRGCVPKKMMWVVADAMHTQAQMAKQGIFGGAPHLNLDSLVKRREERISDIVESFTDQLDEAEITRIAAEATLKSPTEITANGKTYTSEHIVIATGTRPATLDIPGGDLMEQSDDVFKWTKAPEQLVIVGGGYIGCEMAAIFNAYGSQVTIISDGSAVLTEFSAGSQDLAAKNLAASGVNIRLDVRPSEVVKTENGLSVMLNDETCVQATRVLNATGRDPNLGCFGDLEIPDQAETGALDIDAHFETSTKGIYAIGDVANRLPLTPVAREDGKVLAMQLFGDPQTPRIDLSKVATTAFVMPPIGEVGETDDIEHVTTFTAMESLIAGDDLSEGWALQRNAQGGLSGITVVGHAAADEISWAAQLTLSNPSRAQMDLAVAVHPSKAEEPLGSDS